MTGPPQRDDPAPPGFSHGVASGDPLANGVVIWSRYSPVPGAADVAHGIDWEVALSLDFADVVARGQVDALASHDYTVKVDVGGLEPATTYHYRFLSRSGESSPIGRTRTAPHGAVENLRLGVASCASWSNGWFNSYRNLAARDLDLVVHVGDYIYEGSHRAGRAIRPVPRPDPAFRLTDYRRRYALYRTDPDVQALHARHPMAAVWDDHEISSGAWRGGASGHNPRRQGPWADRRAAAVTAYLDWMPLRLPEQSEPDRIYRSLPWGDLAELYLLDTRLVGRDRPARDGRIVLSPGRRDRSLLGDGQRHWLAESVNASTPRWKLLANQVMMAPAGVVAGRIVNPDQWDGYPDERRWLYDLLLGADRQNATADPATANAVVLSGDLHSSWAAELPIGAEFLTPSVTARSFASSLLGSGRWAPLAARIFRTQNRHLRMVDLRHHGYVVLDVNPDRVQADFWHVDTITRRSTAETWAGGWQLHHDQARLTSASKPLTPVRP